MVESRTSVPNLLLVLLCAFMGGFITWALMAGRPSEVVTMVSQASATPATTVAASGRGVQDTIVSAAEKIGPTVVNIDTTLRPHPDIFDPFQNAQPPTGEGSGVIVTADGYILTNNHVIQGATDILVTLPDGRKFKGAVKGADRLSDIAIVKVDATKLPAAVLGDSDKIPIGAFVIAVGNPYGFQHTVTMGVLSGRGRELPEPDKEFRNLLQTDAAINPGNSGGPLVDIDGNVIGINTAIIQQAQGIGFAIPINTARDIMQQLLTRGRVIRTYIGVMLLPLNERIAEQLQIPSDTKGAVVRQIIEGSPADAAGLQPADVIVGVDSVAAKTAADVQTNIRGHKPGDDVTLTILRNGKRQDIKLRVAEMPEQIR